MGPRDHPRITSRRDKNVALRRGLIHGDHAVAVKRSLQRANRINLGHPDLRGQTAQCERTAFADVAESGNNGYLAGNHDVGCPLERIHERFPAAVVTVKFRFGDRIVHVDRAHLEVPITAEFFKA